MNCIEVPGLSCIDIEIKVENFIKKYFIENYESPQEVDLITTFESGYLEKITNFSEDIQDLPNSIEALIDFNNKQIVLSDSTHENLINNIPRAKFTLAHEIGHSILHNNYMNGIIEDGGTIKYLNRGNIPSYKDSEWQANYFAGAFLMPYIHMERLIIGNKSLKEISNIFGTSSQATKIRYDNVLKIINSGKLLTPGVNINPQNRR